MIFLIDHNLKGHALVLFGAIASEGWLDIVPIRFVTFAEMDLSIDSDDRVVWRCAQCEKAIASLISQSDRLSHLAERSPSSSHQESFQRSKIIAMGGWV